MLVLLCLAGLSHAQESDTLPAPEQTIDESAFILDEGPGEDAAPLSSFGVWDFLRMVLVLAVVVALIYGIFHFIKKAGGPRDDGVRFIRVLETRPLAGNRHLHLVEVGNEVLLVGSAENGVSLVSEVADKETRDGIRLAASQANSRTGNFADALKGFFGKGRRGSLPPGEESASSAEGGSAGSLAFMKRQKDRLKKLF
jgi:flagellar protein FliO/FliZ